MECKSWVFGKDEENGGGNERASSTAPKSMALQGGGEHMKKRQISKGEEADRWYVWLCWHLFEC
jgi:hypothetical protein